MTKYEMRVVDSLGVGSPSRAGSGEDDRLDGGGCEPITAFSDIMHPSPTMIGPS